MVSASFDSNSLHFTRGSGAGPFTPSADVRVQRHGDVGERTLLTPVSIPSNTNDAGEEKLERVERGIQVIRVLRSLDSRSITNRV